MDSDKINLHNITYSSGYGSNLTVKVNGKKVNISSFLVSEKDTIEIKDKSKELVVVIGALVNKEREIPDYIQLDEKNKIAKLIRVQKF